MLTTVETRISADLYLISTTCLSELSFHSYKLESSLEFQTVFVWICLKLFLMRYELQVWYFTLKRTRLFTKIRRLNTNRNRHSFALFIYIYVIIIFHLIIFLLYILDLPIYLGAYSLKHFSGSFITLLKYNLQFYFSCKSKAEQHLQLT